MRPANIKSYSPAFQLNSVITNQGISEVIKSANPDFQVGELVVGHVGTENYSIIPEEQLVGFAKVDNKHNLPISYFVGSLGMPGLTA